MVRGMFLRPCPCFRCSLVRFIPSLFVWSAKPLCRTIPFRTPSVAWDIHATPLHNPAQATCLLMQYPARKYDWIAASVRHENRRATCICDGFVGNLVRQRQVSGECQHATQRHALAQRGVQRDRATLRKSGQENIAWRDAAFNFLRDECFYCRLRGADARCILPGTDVVCHDVIPCTHHETAVDGYRLHRCMRKNVTHCGRDIQFVDHRGKVLSVSPQSVQPDDAMPGCLPDSKSDEPKLGEWV